MKVLLNHVLFIIIVIFLFAGSFLIQTNEGLWWDEAVYMGLGQSIMKGYYSLDAEMSIESFRPFMFPLLSSPLSYSLTSVRYLALIISMFAIVSVYTASKKYGIWSVFFTATFSSFIYFSTKVLSESLFIIFLSLSLISFYKANKGDKRYLILCGVFTSLATMTRYLGGILILSYFIFYIYQAVKTRKPLNPMIYILAVLISLIPLYFVGYAYYGNPIGTIESNMYEYGKSQQFHTFYEGLQQIVTGLNILLIAIIPGLYFMLKKKEVNIFLITFVITIVAFLILPHKEPRYLLTFLPIYAIIGAYGVGEVLNKIKTTRIKWITVLILIVIFSYAAFSGYQNAYNDRLAATGLVDACKDVNSLTDQNIMATSYPYVYYLSETRAIEFPDNQSMVMETIRRENIEYVIVYKFEPENPDYVNTYFENNPNFEKVKTYYQWGDPEAAVIYKIRQG